MAHRASVLLSGWLLLAAVVPAPAQVRSDYAAVTWTIEDGLPNTRVQALLQTADGYLWVGTSGGLARFDGVRFTVYTLANTPALESHRILSLHQTADGTLWIGTEHGGVARLQHGVFSTVIRERELPGQFVAAVAEAAPGGLWIATDRGVVRYDGRRIEPVSAPVDPPPRGITAVAEDRHGHLWIGAAQGLYRYAGGAVRRYAEADGLPGPGVLALGATPDGTIWVGTSAGLARIVDDAVVEVALPTGRPQGVTALAAAPDGTVWAALADRAIVRLRDGAARVYTELTQREPSRVRALLVDREGSLWIGAPGDGLVRWRPSLVTVVGLREGLRGRAVMPIMEDRRGTLWIGTCRGPSALRPDGTLVSFDAGSGLRNPCVRAMLEARDGRIWMGASVGLFVFDGRRFEEYTGVPDMPARPVSAIAESDNGDLWVGTADGLLQIAGDRVRWYRRAEGLVHDDVRFLLPARRGGLWIGTTGGLSLLRDGRFTNYTRANGLRAEFVTGILEEEDGTVWIATYGGGLARMKNGAFTHYTTTAGLPDDHVWRVLDDGGGFLWMSSPRGIFRVRRADLEAFAEGHAGSVPVVSYGLAEGLPTLESNGGAQPAGWRTRDGRLWFPTLDGAVVIDPHRSSERPPPGVRIEAVRVDDRPVSGAVVEIPAGGRNLEIDYTAPSLAAPERVRFRYRLDGHDEDWREAGSRRIAYYTALPPGRYTFRVTAHDQYGEWQTDTASLEILQRPHFYQTSWFYALAAVALLVGGRAAHALRVRRLEQRARVLEEVVAGRTAELTDERNKLAQAKRALERAHEDLLATLSGLRLGVLIVGEAGEVVYASPAAEQLLTGVPARGRHWQELLALDPPDAVAIADALERPQEAHARIPVRVTDPGGRRFWLEVDVQPDPRDLARRLVFLYDVSELYDLRRLLDDKVQFHGLVGASRAMQMLYKEIADLGAVDTTVLIEGETGTGKELAARAIHYLSRRRHKPFIAVNCAALTESLLASQLFGHRRGAFTGAVADQTGLFEAAQGGTIFLDEIGDVPPSVQTSLLRVLQEREITRLGETLVRKIDVRVIAASNRDLDRAAAEGRFRQDLLYRIRVVRLVLPPLRERRDDIPLLVAWFLGQARAATGKPVHDVSHEAMAMLLRHPWPGNVRELRSAVESAVIRARGPVVQPADLPAEVRHHAAPAAGARGTGEEARERQRLTEALTRAGGNRAAAARLLGISRATLYRRLARGGRDSAPAQGSDSEAD